jgi:NTP pyrophosphatase (non-canonical NTP hydrolase)
MTTEVVSWIRGYLPDAARDPMNTAIKLSEEAAELIHASYTGDGSVAEELADILILALDIAHLHHVDLEKAFRAKVEINRQRQWTKVKGALKHAPSH